MLLLYLNLVAIVTRGVFCTLSVTGNNDRVAYIGHNVSLSCLIQRDGVDIYHNQNHLPENYTVTWQLTPVNSDHSRLLLTVLISPSSRPRIVQTADGIKYVNSLNDASIMIRDVEFQDAGVYTCSIHTVSQVKNATSDLFVILQPQCHNLKPSLSFHVDEETFFDCVVHYHGNKPPLLLWKHDEQELSSKANRHNSTCVISTLSFRADTKYNGYRFQCLIEYPSAKFYSTCQTNPPLQILFPVHVTKMLIEPHAEKYVYKAGENIILDCLAKGNPQPKYNWYFRPMGDNLKESKLVTEPRYRIINAHASDEGVYNCTVTNDVNGTLYIDSKTIYIKINDPSKVTGGYRFILVQSSGEEEETEKAAHSTNVSPYAIGAIVCAILAVVLIIVFVILAMKFRDQCFLMQMRDKRGRERLPHDQDENMDDQEVELLDDGVQNRMNNDEPQYGRLKLYWEIPRKDIRLVDQIATGKFVEVWKGKMKKYPDSNEIQKVAIKKLKENAVEQERKFFLDEMEVQKMLQPHPNVILLIGCYTFHEPWLLMLEYAQEENLHHYLQHGRPGVNEVEIVSNSVKHKNINSHKLLAVAAQVINGLMHLLKFKLIYYRLKSSNILVGRGGICKLSGFGFPHDITDRNLYDNDTLPIQWMSPESIKHDTYNYRTDIWSYGVLLWEIVHFGLSPYPGLELTETKERILSGERLTHPLHCSTDLYKLMTDCWQDDPMKRMEYEKILQVLSNMASNHSLHILLDSLPEECKFQQAV